MVFNSLDSIMADLLWQLTIESMANNESKQLDQLEKDAVLLSA